MASALMASSSVFAADKNVTFGGTISATLARAGTEATHFVFTRKSNQLRIENTTNKLEPINIIDLEAKKLTIVFPHNTTFMRVDLAKVGAQFSAPPGFPSPPPIPNPKGMPPMPSMPPNPLAGGAMMMPPTPGMGGAPELKKTEKTKKIQEFDCTLYTLSDRGETLEIWATDDAALFPFRLLRRDSMSRHFGPQMLEEQWPELLQKRSLFPLEAILHVEPNGQERLSFKVDKIEEKKITDENLLRPPAGYIEIQSPSS
jgi:hypothetical protein